MANVVRLHPSSYLSVPRFGLIDSLQQTLPRHEIDDWTSFADAMAFIVNCSYASVIEGMRRYSWEEDTIKGRSQGEKLIRQHQYIERIISLINAAQYSPMSQQHWVFGVISQNYTSGQHVEIDLSQQDDMLIDYFQTHNYWFGTGVEAVDGSAPPEFASKVLLFFRGTTVIYNTGMHIQGKLRYMVSFWLGSLGALARILRLPIPFLSRQGLSTQDTMAGIEEDNTGESRFGSKKISRITVESYIKQHGILYSMFRPITLREPAYNSVILAYPSPDNKKKRGTMDGNNSSFSSMESEVLTSLDLRRDFGDQLGGGAINVAIKGLGKKVKKQSLMQNRTSSQAGVRTTLDEEDLKTPEDLDDDRDDEFSSIMCIESFSKVPFRDLGLILPGRSVKLSMAHKVKFSVELIFTICLTVSCAYHLEFNMSSRNTLITTFLAVSIIAMLNVLQSVTDMQHQLQNNLNDWIDQHLVGKGAPYIARLINQVQEQELKEILLGYFFLWKKGPLTQRQLDYEVETFLNDQFKLELDFEVEDALQKLIILKLIEETGGKFRCTQRPKDYLDDPNPKWLQFFHSLRTNDSAAESVSDATPVHSRPTRHHPTPTPHKYVENSSMLSMTHTSLESYSTDPKQATQQSLSNSLTVPVMRRRHV